MPKHHIKNHGKNKKVLPSINASIYYIILLVLSGIIIRLPADEISYAAKAYKTHATYCQDTKYFISHTKNNTINNATP